MNIRTTRITKLAAAGALAVASYTSMAADAVKNIVLVHGAWADGSSWVGHPLARGTRGWFSARGSRSSSPAVPTTCGHAWHPAESPCW